MASSRFIIHMQLILNSIEEILVELFFFFIFFFARSWMEPQVRYINLEKEKFSEVSPGSVPREIRAEQKTGTKFNKMAAISYL